ncbi:hypothetical protein EON65_49545, partial [archaeon]
MLRTELLLLPLLLFVVLAVMAQDRIWTRMNGTLGQDIGYGVAVDTSSGSVYVTGSARGSLFGQPYVANDDIFLLKYASDGTLIWARMVGDSGKDVGRGLAVDSSSGTVYVVGEVGSKLNGQSYAGGSSDIVLLKYASDGTLIWTRMNGTLGQDIGCGVAVDSSSGTVYVVGQVGSKLNGQSYAGGISDIVLLKYASDGTLIWTRMAGNSSSDSGKGVAVDTSSGSVYVTGNAEGALFGQSNAGHTDIFLLKYASDGTLVWARMAGRSGGDSGLGVAVDTSSGTAYVTGQVGGMLNGQPYAGNGDIILLKYASDGTLIWTRMAGNSSSDVGRGLAVDSSSGTVYVVGQVGSMLNGQSYAGGISDIVLLKYASDGTLIWTRMAGTIATDIGMGVAVGSSANAVVYVTGSAGGIMDSQSFKGDVDIITLSYDTRVSSVQPSSQPSVQPSGQPTS